MNFETACKLLLGAEYTFAKTMPEHPHSYTLKKKWKSPEEFEELVQYMRDNSRTDYFKGKPYKMFLINGYKYWTMGAPIPATILINRAIDTDSVSEYDHIAPVYDKLFSSPEAFEEERQLMQIIGKHICGRVLDIGCGSGMLLNHISIPAEKYVGLDPSAMMLSAFRNQHPAHANSLINCKAEHFYGHGFDTIVALFGSASYCQEERLQELIDRSLNQGGSAHLMFYAPDYSPVTYQKSGITVPHQPPPSIFQGVRFGNYILHQQYK